MSYPRRTKMISFRLSEREFEQLRLVSEAQGARSVSDYARLVLCQRAPESQVQSDPDMQQLSGTLHQLSSHVRRLVEILEMRSGRVTVRPQASPTQSGRSGNV